MILHESVTDSGVHYHHTIYEKHDALPPNIRVFGYRDITMAFRGDHVRDHHGRCVPVLYRKALKRKDGSQDLMVVFPGHTYIHSKHGGRPFVWAVHGRKKQSLTTRHRLFAAMVAQGVSDADAYHKVWPSIPKKAVPYRLLALYGNEEFIVVFLKELGIMDSLQQLLEQRGITKETMVDKMIGIMEDKKEVPALRRMAIEKIWDAVTKKERAAEKALPPVDLTQINNTLNLQLTSHSSSALSEGLSPTALRLEAPVEDSDDEN